MLLAREAAHRSPLAPAVRLLLANETVDLSVAPSRNPLDGELALCVARALQTPDVCLWNRQPGQDSSIPTAEFVRQAVRQGLRVLVVAASPAPLERMLVKLAGDATFLAVRFCAPGERASNGPLTRFGLEEQRASLSGRLLVRAEDARAESDARRARLAVEANLWESLAAVVREIAVFDQRCDELAQRLAQLVEEVRREADALTDDDRALATGPFAAQFAIVIKPHRVPILACDKTLLPLRDQRDSLDRSLSELAQEQRRMQPMLAAFRAGRWWTPAYWSTRFNSVLRRHAEGTDEQQRLLRSDRERIDDAIARVEAERQSALSARDLEVSSLVASEVGRRRTEIELQIDIVRRQRGEFVAQWRQTRDQLADADHRAAEPTLELHEQSHQRWLQQNQTDMLTAGLDVNPQDIAAEFLKRMPALAPVLVGTTLALSRQPDFAAAAQFPFDFVVLDDADRLAESDLLDILGRADRALVIGASASTASSFAKLWRLLHRPETPATYQWSHTSDGYVCSLRPLAPADRPFLESERLADFPEIELRILSIPKQPPRLAQVAFPASLSAVDAKTFIYRELQEAAVDRVDRPKQFLDTPERFTIVWECPETPTEETVDLEPGLREAICVHGNQLTTCHIEFDKSAGWTQPKINDWLRRHIPTLDAPRTADLT